MNAYVNKSRNPAQAPIETLADFALPTKKSDASGMFRPTNIFGGNRGTGG